MNRVLQGLLTKFVLNKGRKPNTLEMILLKREAAETGINERKVISFFDRQPVDPNEPIIGGQNLKKEFISETDDEIIERLNKGNKKSISNMKYENAVKAEEAKAAADEDYIMKVLDPEDFSKGGRAGYYGGGAAMVGEDLSEIGHGSDSLMARNMQLAPNSMATTSTGLNYLLGEDNDTVRVPYNEGNMVLPKPKPNADPMVELLRVYNLYQESMPGVSQDTKKYLQQDFIQKLNDAGISQEQFMTNRMQNNFADGGRIGFKGGGADMGAPEKAAERTSRGYGTAPDTGSRRGTNDYSTTTQTQNHDRAMRDNQQPPESNYEKTIGTIQKANDFNKVYQVAKAGSLKPLLAINPYAIGITGLIALDKRRKRKQAYEDSLLEEETLMPFAEGGPARQNFKMGKRAFLKFLGSGVAGIAGLKTGLLGFGKKEVAKSVIAPAAQAANEAAIPPYFFKLVNKIKSLGDDVTEKAGTLDRQKVTKYKDFELTEDVTTGEQTIQRMKVLDDDSASYYGQPLTEETYMSYKPSEKILLDESNPGGGVRKTMPEYEEGTALLRSDREFAGEVVEESAGVSDDIFKEVGEKIPEIIRKEKANGGRIGYKVGKKVIKEGVPSLIKKVNKLLGKDTVTTADTLPIPQKTLDRDMFKNFDDRNPEMQTLRDGKTKSIIPKNEYAEYSKDFNKEILNIPVQQEGKFTKAEYLIQRLENTIKESPDDKYVKETFPNFIKELKDNPELAKNENVFKELGGDLPEGQQIVVYGDDSVDFFTQKSGPGNIDRLKKLMAKHNISREKALKIMKMEPSDQVMEFKMLEVANRKLNSEGGRIGLLAGGGPLKVLINNLAKERGMTGSELLKIMNWKNLPSKIKNLMTKEQFDTLKTSRLEGVERWKDLMISQQEMTKNIDAGLNTPAAGLFKELEKTSPGYGIVPRNVGDQDILQMEQMIKNMKTKDKGRKLNATGGLASMLGE